MAETKPQGINSQLTKNNQPPNQKPNKPLHSKEGNANGLIAEIYNLIQSSPSATNVSKLIELLEVEKGNSFSKTNHFLERLNGDAESTVELLKEKQNQLEKENDLHTMSQIFAKAKFTSSNCLEELQRSKQELNRWKLLTCKYMIELIQPENIAVEKITGIDEWEDAAALSELRHQKKKSKPISTNAARLIPLYSTFRSIICSYQGPSQYFRQIEELFSSIQSLFDNKKLRFEAVHASEKLVEASKELDTVRMDLEAVRARLGNEPKKNEEKNQTWKKLLLVSILGLLLMGAGATLYFVLQGIPEPSITPKQVISQNSCVEIYRSLQNIKHYSEQVLAFQKFGTKIYFQANHLTCEKLHKLSEQQVRSLSALLQEDMTASTEQNPSQIPVLKVKDIGINKLAVKLNNSTNQNSEFKLKVLEHANGMHAVLRPGNNEQEDDLVVMDLTLKNIKPNYE